MCVHPLLINILTHLKSTLNNKELIFYKIVLASLSPHLVSQNIYEYNKRQINMINNQLFCNQDDGQP